MKPSPVTCSGADGRCEHPAAKAGLCWAHFKRKQKGRPLSEPVREKTDTPLEALFRAMLEYRDELETATDEDFQRGRERVRDRLRRYLWVYVPRLLRRHPWTPSARLEVEAFLATYGDKAGHGRIPRSHQPHLQHPHHPHRR